MALTSVREPTAFLSALLISTVESVQLHRRLAGQDTGGELRAIRCKASIHLPHMDHQLTSGTERPLQPLHGLLKSLPRYPRWLHSYRYPGFPRHALVQGPRHRLHHAHEADRRYLPTRHGVRGSVE